MIVARILLYIAMGLNLIAAGLNIMAACRLRAARKSAIRVCEVYSKALEALILAENENIHTEKEGE